MSQDIANTNLLKLIAKDKNLIYKILNIKGVTQKRDIYEVSGDVQMTLYDYFHYWTTFRPTNLIRSLECADYLGIARELEIAKLNGEI
jgi:hypothetical protein